MIIYTFTIPGYLNDEVIWFTSLKETFDYLKTHLRRTGVEDYTTYVVDIDKYIETYEGKDLHNCYHIARIADRENYNPNIYLRWTYIEEK